MADQRPPRGYGNAAPTYVGAGWAPFPLPAGKKSPPPTGYTGADGRTPTQQDVMRWCSSNAFGNIGLHLPPTIVGIDVDNYEGKDGGKTLSELEQQHGPLPATWSSTSRGEGVSRISFYRIPAGVTFPGVLGTGIDVIQNHHRYAVVAPSTHPDSGERYRWYTPEGVLATQPPRVDDLPDLPTAWVEALQWRPHAIEPAATASLGGLHDELGAGRKAALSSDDSIAERINAEHRWHDVLLGDGWQAASRRADATDWVRPGKDSRKGISAVLHEPDGPFNVFSTSVPALQWSWAERKAGTLWSYSMFGYLAATRYQGDRSACARDYRLQANATDAQYRTLQTAKQAVAVLDDEPQDAGSGLQIIDWTQQRDPSVEVIEGLAISGRWTAIAAAAKAGKSTLLIALSVETSEGRDPFDGRAQEPVNVLYVDAEMGRLDLEERLVDGGYEPTQLARWHACELAPRLDTVAGGEQVVAFVSQHDVRLVVIDGINGVVAGAEKDDTPWRDLFDFTIKPLKERGVAVITADNLGKDKTLGPRGSSVKVDKADAVIQVTRTEGGVKLTASHRRTAAYPSETELDIVGVDGSQPIRYRRRGGPSWPAGTKAATLVLIELGVPLEAGRPTVEAMLKAAAQRAVDNGVDGSRYRIRSAVLGAAIKWRKRESTPLFQDSQTCSQTREHAQSLTIGNSSGNSGEESAADQGGNSGGNSGNRGGRVDGNSGGCMEYTPCAQPHDFEGSESAIEADLEHPADPF